MSARRRSQQAIAKGVPPVGYENEAGDGFWLRADAGSTIRIVAPQNLVVTTYPPSEPVETARRRVIRSIEIPGAGFTRRVQIEAAAPLLRNPLCAPLVRMSLWTPIRYIVALVGGLASGQLQKMARGLSLPCRKSGLANPSRPPIRSGAPEPQTSGVAFAW